MNKKEMYVLREDIFILLCSDGFIRVYKKIEMIDLQLNLYILYLKYRQLFYYFLRMGIQLIKLQ